MKSYRYSLWPPLTSMMASWKGTNPDWSLLATSQSRREWILRRKHWTLDKCPSWSNWWVDCIGGRHRCPVRNGHWNCSSCTVVEDGCGGCKVYRLAVTVPNGVFRCSLDSFASTGNCDHRQSWTTTTTMDSIRTRQNHCGSRLHWSWCRCCCWWWWWLVVESAGHCVQPNSLWTFFEDRVRRTSGQSEFDCFNSIESVRVNQSISGREVDHWIAVLNVVVHISLVFICILDSHSKHRIWKTLFFWETKFSKITETILSDRVVACLIAAIGRSTRRCLRESVIGWCCSTVQSTQFNVHCLPWFGAKVMW